MVSASLSVVAFAALALTSSVDAHGTLAKPGLKFTGTAYGGDYSATIPTSVLKPVGNDHFHHYPDTADGTSKNNKAFDDAFKASSYKTLKDFILKNQDMSKGLKKNPVTPECGFTTTAGASVQALPDQLEWYGGGMNHPGPCEVWCDNEIALPYTGNCVGTFPQGKIKYDKSKCTGKSQLTLYWMSTLLEWQVYIDCAKIGSGTPVAGEATPAPAAKPAAAPAAAPKPAAAPAAAPKPATAPAATSKCKVRRD